MNHDNEAAAVLADARAAIRYGLAAAAAMVTMALGALAVVVLR